MKNVLSFPQNDKIDVGSLRHKNKKKQIKPYQLCGNLRMKQIQWCANEMGQDIPRNWKISCCPVKTLV